MSDPGVPCSGCGQPVIWTMSEKKGKRMPVVSTFMPHFATCPMAERFRKNSSPPAAAGPVHAADGDNDPDQMLADGDPGEP